MAARKGADKRKISPDEMRRQIESDVQAFLSRGGKIAHIEEGISGEPGWTRPEDGFRPNTRVNIQLPISHGSL